MKTCSTITVILFLSILASISHAEDWPGWRGPRGDGISRDTDAPLHWSATENIVWKTPILGVGRSSPITSGDRVFVTTGDLTDETRRVICLDRTSGKIEWNVAVHKGPGGKMHRFNTTASSTPTADGERVYSVFVDDHGMQVVAVDFSGKIVWSVNPGNFFSQHGFAACPVLFGEGVIVNGQQDGDAFAVMLDRRTGKEVWRYKPAVNLRSFSTPVLIEHEGRPQMILSGASQTVALDPNTGRIIWFASGPSEKFVCTPAVGHGLVYSFGGSPEKKAMAVKLGGSGDVLDTHVVWRNERAMPYIPSPLLVGDFLHVISDTGIYTCLDPKTGESLYTGRKLKAVNSSPVAVADRVYFFEDSGTCTVIKNGANFEVIATNEIDETVYATPAISSGNLFVRTETHLVCIGSPANSASAAE
ncbi:MAG: PQQ-binding-like beta-propeller repeat protein [Planctomycetales bacterium]|nr:PQQ-binding-like beta-propeller repeat protein [Planctomycetales bacterium]